MTRASFQNLLSSHWLFQINIASKCCIVPDVRSCFNLSVYKLAHVKKIIP